MDYSTPSYGLRTPRGALSAYAIDTGTAIASVRRCACARRADTIEQVCWHPCLVEEKLRPLAGSPGIWPLFDGPRETHDYRNYNLLVRGINSPPTGCDGNGSTVPYSFICKPAGKLLDVLGEHAAAAANDGGAVVDPPLRHLGVAPRGQVRPIPVFHPDVAVGCQP